MEITRSGGASEIHRCPFCHESVGESDEQVACKRCLARHHHACWSEGGRCASCQETTPLVSEGAARAGAAPGDVIAPVERDATAPDERRRAAARLLEAAERTQDAKASWFLAFPTLGIHPIVTAEAALTAHVTRNTEEMGPLPYVAEDLKKRLEQARVEAEGRSARTTRQGLLVLAYLGVAAGALFGVGLSTSPHWFDQEVGAAALGVAYFVFCALLAGWLHSFREAVRRHEFEQFFAKLVGDAASPERIQQIADARQKAWSDRRSEDTWTSILGGVFLGPLFLLPYAAVRARGALTLHSEHEKLLDGVAAARKETAS